MGIYFNPGNESFTRARNSQIFVDKTGLIEYLNKRMSTEENCIALTHARRFGKSHAAGMIDAYYSLGCDSTKLFEDTKIAENSDFKNKTSETVSLLDRLKKALKLDGASKGLQNVSSSAKKIDLSNAANSADNLKSKFSALEVVGVTALVNIANSAIETGKQLLSSITIDPIIEGFHEYETQMNAIQTILANTSSKGSTLEDVNKALDDLKWRHSIGL